MLPTNQTTLGIIQGIVNKGAVLPIALSIILIVFAVLVMVLIKPNQKYKRTTNRIIMDESPVGRCNQLIKRYNDLSAAITTEVNAKITEAIAKYDADASRIIQTYAASANKKHAEIRDYITRAKDCIAINDVIGLNYVLQAMDADLYVFEDILTEIRNLEIKDMFFGAGNGNSKYNRSWNEYKRQYGEYRNTQMNQQSASDQSVFFKGCKTKEELTTRYKNLAKTLHPDAKCGSTEAFQDMKAEYEKLLEVI